MAMSLEKGLDYLKDGIDCQNEGARSLRAVKRAYPELAPGVQKVLDSMETVKANVKEVEAELMRIGAPDRLL
ncbi:hypothetical protein LPN04_31535 [Rugamonas sp. A1-17]|nr:hypothetical protein [Rugamonas sp. A1-17]